MTSLCISLMQIWKNFPTWKRWSSYSLLTGKVKNDRSKNFHCVLWVDCVSVAGFCLCGVQVDRSKRLSPPWASDMAFFVSSVACVWGNHGFPLSFQSIWMGLVLDAEQDGPSTTRDIGNGDYHFGVYCRFWDDGVVWDSTSLRLGIAKDDIHWGLSNNEESTSPWRLSIGRGGYCTMAILVFNCLDCSLRVSDSLDDRHRGRAFANDIWRIVQALLRENSKIPFELWGISEEYKLIFGGNDGQGYGTIFWEPCFTQW